MIGFNHALVGGLIGKLLPLPIAIPLSIASHFILDALPHYGIPQHHRDSSKFWKYFFILEFFATIGLAVWALANHHYAMYICGQLAVLPDFVWVAKVIKNRSFNLTKTRVSPYERWHIRIQRFERRWGIWVELPLAAILFYWVVLRTN
jgi:hypothetical protein